MASCAAEPYARDSGQAAIFFFDEDFLPDFDTLTSLRFLTVYPSGRVPSFIIRRGQRLQAGLSLQHFFFGVGGTIPR